MATESTESTVPAATERAQPPRHAQWMPPLWVWFVMLLSLGTVLVVQMPETMDGFQAGISTLILGFVALASMLSWFVLFSGQERVLRWSVGVTALVAAATLCSTVRIDGFWGSFWPILSWRWNPPSDHRLAVPDPQRRSGVDLLTTTPDDFPQFLGPDRSNAIDGVTLARNWNAKPPKRLWRQPIGAGWSSFSAVNGFALTMEQRGKLEMVTCYDVRTGKVHWYHAVDTRHQDTVGGHGPRCTPTIHDGKVYALGATGILWCLDGATGEVLWQRDLLVDFGIANDEHDRASDRAAILWGRAASPLIVDATVVVPAGGPRGGPYTSLVAYDADTGDEIWRGGDQQISYSSPALATLCGVRQILIVNESSVSGHDPATGETFWTHPWKGHSNGDASATQAVAVDGQHVFLSKAYGVGSSLVQIRRSEIGQWSAKTRWAFTAVMKTKYANVVVHRKHVYGLDNGILQCIELSTGRRRWKHRDRFGPGQILRVGDVLLVQTEWGDVVMLEFSPGGAKELGRIEALEGVTWNNLCLHGRYLLVRNAQQAACFELEIER